MKKYLTLLFLFLHVFIYAQQQPVISQFMLNNYFFNPAYTSSGEQFSMSALYRSQWTGYQDHTGESSAPELQLFNLSANIGASGHHTGVQLMRDQTAAITTYMAQISYAYRISLSERSILAVGMRGGILSKSIDFGQYKIKHPDDPLIKQGTQTENIPDLTLGLWLMNDKYYAGISAMGIIPNENDFLTTGLQHEKTYTATLGYNIPLGNDWKITPSIITITNTNKFYTTGSLLLKKNEFFWTGVSGTNNRTLTGIAGLRIAQKLFVSYAYEYSLKNADITATASHEIQMQYRYGTLRKRKKPAEETPVEKIR